MFLGYANQWVLTPIIPLYVEDLGGSAFVAGLALLAFSVPSFTVRPLVGHLADKWSAAGVLLTGLALLATGTLLFLLPFLAALFIGNFVRGVAWAGVNTGGYTTLATAAPQERRGEAAGYYTSVTASVTIAFPALGLWMIAAGSDYTLVFALSVLLALLGVPVAWRLAKNAGAIEQHLDVARRGRARRIHRTRRADRDRPQSLPVARVAVGDGVPAALCALARHRQRRLVLHSCGNDEHHRPPAARQEVGRDRTRAGDRDRPRRAARRPARHRRGERHRRDARREASSLRSACR